ncbi:hypothetical protein ABW02_15145 [Niallia circulans]|uniref:Uncharacterized protein n=1 Tax=Niallia circulans TaxID=1397 RepID=A0A0J1L9V0_NIACI|nr:hypothetical protein [Niallia circulans]KLV25705.1 hypothetical protein ABW02_15145 [Niallia circulans]
MEKVELPLDVYNAFENLNRVWNKLGTKEEINLMFMQILFIATDGIPDSMILKKYAIKNPTKYLQSLVNGYTLENYSKVVVQVSHKLDDWMNRTYQGSKEQDRFNFAQELTGFIKEELLNQK